MRGPDASQRWTLQLLGDLERRGLLAHVLGGRRRKLWHVTPRGAQLAEQGGRPGRRPRLLRGEGASAALHAHTLAVNDTCIAWLHAARARGDDFGPLAWQHEVAHPDGRSRRPAVVADALLTYLVAEAEGEAASLEFRLLELDRATLSVDRLAAKLARYAELHRASDKQGAPVWRAWYPTFPVVHVVLTGASPTVLTRRRDAVLALAQTDPRLQQAPDLAISLCLLADLQREGPFAPILTNREGDVTDWLGRYAPGQRPRS